MSGWQKPVSPPTRPSWTEEVCRLYLISDMEVDEFEQLYDVALTGQRPDHPKLPAYLGLTETVMR